MINFFRDFPKMQHFSENWTKLNFLFKNLWKFSKFYQNFAKFLSNNRQSPNYFSVVVNNGHCSQTYQLFADLSIMIVSAKIDNYDCVCDLASFSRSVYFSSNRRLFGHSAFENFVEPLIVISHPVRLGSSVVDRSVLGVKFWNFGWPTESSSYKDLGPIKWPLRLSDLKDAHLGIKIPRPVISRSSTAFSRDLWAVDWKSSTDLWSRSRL